MAGSRLILQWLKKQSKITSNLLFMLYILSHIITEGEADILEQLYAQKEIKQQARRLHFEPQFSFSGKKNLSLPQFHDFHNALIRTTSVIC